MPAYLVKDRIAEGDQLIRAMRMVSTGGSVLDPKVVEGVLAPASGSSLLAPGEAALLHEIAGGRSLNMIAAARRATPASVSAEVESLLKLARKADLAAPRRFGICAICLRPWSSWRSRVRR